LQDLSGGKEIVVERPAWCEDAIIVHHPKRDNLQLKIYDKEIVVDATCGAAVLWGAHIYAPGVMGMITGILQMSRDEVNGAWFWHILSNILFFFFDEKLNAMNQASQFYWDK
jgi:hypothetical protein